MSHSPDPSDVPLVETVSSDKRTLHLDNGEAVPVTNWMDSEGVECSPIDAVRLVGGPTQSGEWVFTDLSYFEYLPGETSTEGSEQMPPVPGVEHIDLDKAHVLLSTGEVLAVRCWLDEDSGPAESRSEAAMLVTEPDQHGFALRIDIHPEVIKAS